MKSHTGKEAFSRPVMVTKGYLPLPIGGCRRQVGIIEYKVGI